MADSDCIELENVYGGGVFFLSFAFSENGGVCLLFVDLRVYMQEVRKVYMVSNTVLYMKTEHFIILIFLCIN